jgi:hypothetical protein
MTGRLATGLAALGAFGLVAVEAAAQQTVRIFGDIDTTTGTNPFGIVSGDDVVITATYINPGFDPLLMLLIDVFDDGTMDSLLSTPFTEADDFGFASGNGPQYDLVNGELDQISFLTASLDPSLSFGATSLSSGNPTANLLFESPDLFRITGLNQVHISPD